MKANLELPRRFFGPVSRDRAEQIAELLLDSKKFKESLITMLTDETTPRDFSYETQAYAENIDLYLDVTRGDGDVA